MPGEKKQPICPNCGSEAKCFRRERFEWWSRFEDYSILCPKCSYHETQTKHGGYVFFVWRIHLPTTCPFCGKPPAEHAKGATLKELQSGLHSVREEVFNPDPDADICPKCERGEVVCTYLGSMGAAGCFRWEHTCTNPDCDLRQTFPFWSDECDAEKKFGPGKADGCPGPHK